MHGFNLTGVDVKNSYITAISIFLLSLFTIPKTINAQEREQDSLALVAIYNSMGGENWNDRTNWLTAEPINNWYGINVSNNRVVQIYLGSNNLIGNLPEEIGNLTKLENLVLYGNHIENPLPVSLKNLTSLWEVVLNGNELTGTFPLDLCDMTTLTHINLQHNQLSGSIPAEIGKLTNLIDLHLSYNQFDGNLPVELGSLTKLDGLFLSGNQLSGAIPAEFVNLTGLMNLVLDNNNFDQLPDLSSLANLSDLNVEFNRFTFADIEPNIGIPNFTYSPQDSIGASKDTTIAVGSQIELSITVGGTANQYQWMKDGVDIPEAVASTYTISSAQAADAGSYVCKISNTLVTELVLYSRPIDVTVEESSALAGFSPQIPVDYQLFQNYPNPFNPSTNIQFSIPKSEFVRLAIYNLLGQQVAILMNEMCEAGYHIILFDAAQLTSGVYFCTIRADRYTAVKKMLLVK